MTKTVIKPKTSPARVMRTYDVPAILDRIRNGESQREIAASLQIPASTLNSMLNKDATLIVQSARARSESAEAWADKGLDIISLALNKDSEIDVQAAKAYEQACRWRAAVRNPAYRDKQDLTHSNPDGTNITGLTVSFISSPAAKNDE